MPIHCSQLAAASSAASGMAFSRLQIINVIDTDIVIAVGTAVAIGCRPLVSFPLAPRFFGWAAGFSYSLYATHLPLVFLIIAFLQNIGFPSHKILPGLLAFTEVSTCVVLSLVFAYLFSLFTERQTDRFRSWLKAAMSLEAARQAGEPQLEKSVGAAIPAALSHAVAASTMQP